jgi:hypothetical protein
MSAIVWNPNNFHLIDAMPKGEKYSARYDIDNILIPLYQRLIPTGKCKLVIHINNPRCQVAKVALDFMWQIKIRFACIPHMYGIEHHLTFRFGHLQGGLRDSRFQTAREPLSEVGNLVREISPEISPKVFATGLHGAKM